MLYNMRLVEVQQLVMRLVDPDFMDRDLREVIGVTELYGHLYVLQNKLKSIHVSLADKPYSMLSDVPLDGVIEPTDIAASTVDSCLYVTDAGENGCIWRVKVEEHVAESPLQHVELKLDQNASESEGISAEPTSTVIELAQGSETDDGREVKETNGTDVSAASVADDVSVTGINEQNEKQPISETQHEASKLQEPFSRDREQHKQADIDLQKFLRMISGCEVGVMNVTDAVQHNKPELSPGSGHKLMKDKNAGEMIRSLLERTGLTKKILERGNAGPCVFAISRHYSAKRFLFHVDVRLLLLKLLMIINVARRSCLGL